ncbi:MAG: hypothetical protein K2Y21_04150 [Phycisphaerales bacterium]|nr:hypothetical protein [Phycisphaerales bacterium]
MLQRIGKALTSLARGTLAALVGVAAITPMVARAQTGDSPTPARVYYMEVTGEFGYEITQTPIREAMRDARNQGADVVIVKLDSTPKIGEYEKLPDDKQSFDELFRAQEILPIFTDEIRREWTKKPRIVFWVKKAMGGAAFMPFVAPEIYMTSDARMGGVGGIGVMLGSTGDEVVRQKQYSLRMARAEGYLIAGGYDPKIIRAMAEPKYVLSYRLEGGRPVFLERLPERPDEFVLTTDEDDSMEAVVRGQTRSVLTLTADTARAIGVSKGTADNFDDLMFQLGLSRNHTMIQGRAARILDGWKRDVEIASKEIKKRLEEFSQGAEGQGANTYDARTQMRGKQIRQIDEIIARLTRFQEAFGPRWHGVNGVPPVSQFRILKEQIELQQLIDKK